MSYGYGGNYSGYNPQGSIDRINQQMQQLQMLQNQYQQQMGMQPNNIPPMQGQNSNPNMSAMSNRGTYVYVQDYQEVVNYPTPADGNAVLFFNLDKGILWSKKFVNGSNSIQAFTIAPLNNVSNEMVNNTSTEEKPVETAKNVEITDNMLTRITQLEDKFDRVLDLLSNKTNKSNNHQNNNQVNVNQNGKKE